MISLLVIDDVPELLKEIKALLKPHFAVSVCGSPKRGIAQALKSKPDIVMTALMMKEMGGMEVIRQLRTENFTGKIVLITRFGDASTAFEATRLGADDYITRPIFPPELVSRIRRVAGLDLAGESGQLATLQDSVYSANPRMLAMLELAQLAANSDTHILIIGETGVGKENLARAVHRMSSRFGRPFVTLNCAAINPERIDAELFGSESRGGSERHGRVHAADNGTLYIDQINEIPLSTQEKILHAMQRGVYVRPGGHSTSAFPPRVIASTNRDLGAEIRRGNFRSDLFYCLSVVTLNVPPLRDRPDDIPLLAGHLLKKFVRPGRSPRRFSSSALALLCRYPWPGNVSEFQNLVERISVGSKREIIEVDELPEHIKTNPPATEDATPTAPGSSTFRQAKKLFEREYFKNVLTIAEGSFAAAARIAGMERTAFYRKAKSALN